MTRNQLACIMPYAIQAEANSRLVWAAPVFVRKLGIVSLESRIHNSGRYFYWGSIRLDRDPLNVHPTPSANAKPREATPGDCTDVELDFWVFEPSWLQQIFVFSALPAFLLEGAIPIGANHFGMSQVPIFMGTLPPLIVSWYYFLGWTGDRLLDKVRRRV